MTSLTKNRFKKHIKSASTIPVKFTRAIKSGRVSLKGSPKAADGIKKKSGYIQNGDNGEGKVRKMISKFQVKKIKKELSRGHHRRVRSSYISSTLSLDFNKAYNTADIPSSGHKKTLPLKLQSSYKKRTHRSSHKRAISALSANISKFDQFKSLKISQHASKPKTKLSNIYY